MEHKHMPFPWQYTEIGATDDGREFGAIFDADYALMADRVYAEDAEFIIRACNSHDDLVAALHMLVCACEESKWPLTAEQMMPLAMARAALAKAKGD